QGGGARYAYPKYVWSPAGGWWAEPRSWKANTIMAGVLIAAACVPLAYLSSQREVWRTIC
ncbi:uncharacterized protein MONBRDRAFT_15467, partial [Monosiga brevicollis MX1]